MCLFGPLYGINLINIVDNVAELMQSHFGTVQLLATHPFSSRVSVNVERVIGAYAGGRFGILLILIFIVVLLLVIFFAGHFPCASSPRHYECVSVMVICSKAPVR